MQRTRKIVLILVLASLALVILAADALAVVNQSAAGRLYSNTTEIPHRRVGLVLGCSRLLGNGSRNPFFDTRIRAASELFRAGKVDYLLVSGDNHTRGYDEATDMRNSLLQQGILADRIYSDCAGFRTLDSMVRARDVFQLTQITIISQQFHNERAIFLARHSGIDAIGYNAQDADLGDVSGTHMRDKLAKVKAVVDVYVLRTKPHFLGATVSIGIDPPIACSAAQAAAK